MRCGRVAVREVATAKGVADAPEIDQDDEPLGGNAVDHGGVSIVESGGEVMQEHHRDTCGWAHLAVGERVPSTSTVLVAAFLLVEYMASGSFLSVRAGVDAVVALIRGRGGRSAWTFARYNLASVAADVACVARLRWTPSDDQMGRHERTGGRAASELTGLGWLTGAG